MKNCLLLIAALVLVSSLPGCNEQQETTAKSARNGYHQQKVVYQINDIESAYGALRNVSNHLNALGDENAKIVVVTHGSGALALVDGHKDSKGHSFEASVQDLVNRGVKFQICANTIRGKKIQQDLINMNAEVVPSGVAQIAHLQQSGYMYLKP